MNPPKVSVIIPVYNTEDYIGQTLRSIAEQTLSDLEIIVVNDGSTDGSLPIVERIAADDPRITIHSQPNRGLSEARNAGLERARGEFLYFMDSDDLLERDALSCCYGRCVRDRLDFVLFDADIFGETDSCRLGFDYYRARYLDTAKVYEGPELLGLLLEKRIYRASACLSFTRTEFVRRNGLKFPPGIVHEDELYTAKLYLAAARVGAIDRAFFKRRVRAGSIMTAGYSRRHIDGYLTVARELQAYGRTQPKPIRAVVRKTIRYMLNPAVYGAHRLPAGERFGLLWHLASRWPGTIRPKNLAVLMFKRPADKILHR